MAPPSPKPSSSNAASSSSPDSSNDKASAVETSSTLSASQNSPGDLSGDTNQRSSASTRLNQLSSHLSSGPVSPDDPPKDITSSANTSKTRQRRPKSQIAALPPDYSDILSHVSTLRTIAATPDHNNRGYSRQKLAGKLWVRERIAALLDPGSFREIGAVTGTVEWRTDPSNPTAEKPVSFIPSNNPQGYGTLTCPRTGMKREILLTADDFSIRAGHADGAMMAKTLFVEQMCLKLKMPIVKLVDGSSGGGSVTTIKKNGYAYMPLNIILKPVVEQLNLGIPNLGAVVGSAMGLGAARVVSTHFSVMAADVGSLFNAGPKVVEGATFEEGLSFSDLGGPSMHCTNGTIDNMAKDEEGCFEQIRTVLGYLPNCGSWEAPPVVECVDPVDREDVALRSVIPRKKNRMYNPWTIIESVVDRGSWFEIGALWGRTGITGLARLGGRPVGIISLNCEVNGGALDAQGSQKLTRLLKLCDVMNLPVLQFLDIREDIGKASVSVVANASF
jgi:acetyl-CoA carboxylase carboxyltransferase component